MRADGNSEGVLGAGDGRLSLVQELEELRKQVRALEAELDRYRSQEEQLGKTLSLATSYAARIKEEARADAQLALRKARARADEALGGLERERSRAEQELLRLQLLSDETRTRLSAFLTSALAELGVEAHEEVGPTVTAAELEETLGDVLEITLRKEGPPQPSPWLKSIKP